MYKLKVYLKIHTVKSSIIRGNRKNKYLDFFHVDLIADLIKLIKSTPTLCAYARLQHYES